MGHTRIIPPRGGTRGRDREYHGVFEGGDYITVWLLAKNRI